MHLDSAVDFTDPDLPPTLFVSLHCVGIEAGSNFPKLHTAAALQFSLPVDVR